MSEFKERPEGLDGEIFDLLFKSAEIVNFAARERKEYIKDMTTRQPQKRSKMRPLSTAGYSAAAKTA